MFELVYLALALFVGLIAYDLRGGFLLWFILALLITPPGALLALIIFLGWLRRKPRLA